MRAIAALAAITIVLAAACGGGGSSDKRSAEEKAAAICNAMPAVLGTVTVQAPEIIEASGIAASRQNKDVLWVHNDSGDSARVFAIDRAGRLLGTFALAGVQEVDWEDMAIGPGPERGVDYLYLADIGDNAAQRSEVIVYRVKEPEVSAGDAPVTKELDGVQKLVLRYPDHPHDAETFMVDWMNHDLLIVTKELAGNISSVFRAHPDTMPDTPTTLDEIATFDFSSLTLKATPGPDAPTLVAAVPLLPTGGDMSRDASVIAIRTYASVWVWARSPDATMADVFATRPCEAPSAVEQQGEAIAFDPDGSGYTTVSEGASPALNHFVAK